MKRDYEDVELVQAMVDLDDVDIKAGEEFLVSYRDDNYLYLENDYPLCCEDFQEGFFSILRRRRDDV